jgi:hypothetical protein
LIQRQRDFQRLQQITRLHVAAACCATNTGSPCQFICEEMEACVPIGVRWKAIMAEKVIDLIEFTREMLSIRPSGKPESNFIVTVHRNRRTSSVSATTAAEAISEADRNHGRGSVTIIDPHNVEYSPTQFEDMLIRWDWRLR